MAIKRERAPLKRRAAGAGGIASSIRAGARPASQLAIERRVLQAAQLLCSRKPVRVVVRPGRAIQRHRPNRIIPGVLAEPVVKLPTYIKKLAPSATPFIRLTGFDDFKTSAVKVDRLWRYLCCDRLPRRPFS